MQFSNVLVVASLLHNVVSTEMTRGQHASFMALEQIMGRQFELCKEVSVRSCSLSCGAGYEICRSWPTCYNPTEGETCCSNGRYCKRGYYCTSSNCCPEGLPLSKCGARSTLSTLLPGSTSFRNDFIPATRTTRTRPTITSIGNSDDDDDNVFTTTSEETTTSTTSSRSTTTTSRRSVSVLGSSTASLVAVPIATTNSVNAAGVVRPGVLMGLFAGLVGLVVL